ncbi:MAG: oligosaccharide flippase family protein [Sphingomonadaceae bacterium]
MTEDLELARGPTRKRRPSVTRNLAANLVGQAWITLMMIGFVPVFIRHLGIEAYGIIGLFTTFQALLAILDAGMGPTLNREMARFTSGAREASHTLDLLRTLETLAALLAGALAGTLILLAKPLSTSWLNPETLPREMIRTALMLMGAALACRFLESIYRASLLGLQQQVWYNGANILLNTLRHAGAATLVAYLSANLTTFFAWYLAISVLIVGVLRWKLLRVLPHPDRPTRFSVDELIQIRHFAMGMLAVSVLAVSLTQVDKLLLSQLLPLESFGVYMLSFSVASILGLIAAAVTQALLPVMVEQVTRSNFLHLHRIFHFAAQIVAIFVVPVGLLLMVFPRDLLFLWSGDPALAHSAAPILRLLAAGSTLHALLTVPYFSMVAHGWTRLAVLTNIIAVCLLVPSILIAVPAFGMEAAAIIWILLNAGYLLFQIPLVHRHILTGEMWRWYRADVAQPILIASFVVMALAAIRPHLELSRLMLMPWLLVSWAVMVAALLLSAQEELRERLAALRHSPQAG